VRGIAQLGDEIFVISDSAPSILVFTIRALVLDKSGKPDIRWHQLTAPPQDVAASAKRGGLLFVADADSGQCVWTLDRCAEREREGEKNFAKVSRKFLESFALSTF